MAEAELNGLRPAKIQAILDSMKNDPEVLKAVTGPWKARVVWQSGFKTKAYMRKHAVEMDEPEGRAGHVLHGGGLLHRLLQQRQGLGDTAGTGIRTAQGRGDPNRFFSM